jgi:hypothetical protein
MQTLRAGNLNALLVSESASPDMMYLEENHHEVSTIIHAFEHRSLVPTVLSPKTQGAHGVRTETVLEALPRATIVHFACHGNYSRVRPLDSDFYMRDGIVPLRDLMRINVPDAFLAYLSACDTAYCVSNGSVASNHIMESLAATMLFMGYKSVVGTMGWVRKVYSNNFVCENTHFTLFRRVVNPDCLIVAEGFYRELLRKETIEADDVAYALDVAVTGLRESGLPTPRWMPFIHIGAWALRLIGFSCFTILLWLAVQRLPVFTWFHPLFVELAILCIYKKLLNSDPSTIKPVQRTNPKHQQKSNLYPLGTSQIPRSMNLIMQQKL